MRAPMVIIRYRPDGTRIDDRPKEVLDKAEAELAAERHYSETGDDSQLRALGLIPE